MPLHPEAREKVWLKVRDENCQLCPLSKTANSVCLLGDGPVPSRVLLVGEAPGAREDDIARPFSGPAGNYLDRILSEVGLPRDGLYITNSVRCRPPENATPTRGQIKACSGYMQSELEIVRPDFILLLGNVALQAVLGQSGIMSKRGTSTTISGGPNDGAVVFSTVHPAAVLRNPAFESLFRADLMTFARLVRGEERRPETKTSLVRNSLGLAKLCRMLEAVDGPIAFDVETDSSVDDEDDGLSPWSPTAIINTVSFTWKAGRSYVVALEHRAQKWDIPIERVYEALNISLSGKKMVNHNVKFDAKWMQSRGVDLIIHGDTMAMIHLLDENSPRGLKALARIHLGAPEYADVPFSGDTEDHLIRLAIYNGKDTNYTLQLYHLFRERLMEHPRLVRLYSKLTMPAIRALTSIETVGFPVDIKRLEERHKEAVANIERVTKELLTHVSKDLRPIANFRSPVFLGKWLFDDLKLPVIEYTPKGARSTNESVLIRLAGKHPGPKLLMELRKWNKYESTYTRNWIHRVRRARKPRLYTSYNIAGTVTGRLSSDMQQVPRDLFVRGIIGTRPGWKFVEADFSQVELRLAAMLSGDRTLIRAFNNGEDPHLQTAAAVLGKPESDITKEERKMAKAVNFGFLYGMWWKKFKKYAKDKYNLEVTDEEAKAYREAFFKRYASLATWHDRQRRVVHNLGEVRSPIGRVRHLPNINSTDDGVVGEAEREAINAPVQGLASDLTVLSMVRLHAVLDPKKARIIGNVHDSIILEVRDEEAESVSRLVKEVMENLPLKKYFGWSPTVPIEAEVTIGTHWGES